MTRPPTTDRPDKQMNPKSITYVIFVLLFCTSLFAQQPEAKIEVTRPRVPDLEIIHELTACEYLNGSLGTNDFDLDGIDNCDDNCIFDRNKNQKDTNKNGVGDACEWRARRDEEWEKTGRQQRLTATEPVNLARLVSRSSAIFLAKVSEGFSPDFPHILGGWGGIEILRQLKGRPVNYQTKERGPWVYFPDGGPKEIVGSEILLFLKNGRIRQWKPPHVYSGDPLPDGSPYIEKHYFGYELADKKFGVLGVSKERLQQLEKIIKMQN